MPGLVTLGRIPLGACFRQIFSMRILLSHHAPIQQSPAGILIWQWALALEAAGDEVRLLVADQEHRFGERLPVERVVCGNDPNADLQFALPRFSDEEPGTGRPAFDELSDAQLARYRDCLRRRLDNLIMRFDPHVIHAQHIWILGQLALESGVPYVLNAWHSELDEYERDARYQPLVEQAAENASRILVPDEVTKRRVETLFESTADRIVVMPARASVGSHDAAEQIATGQQLHAIYQALLAERFG
jgi:hypothetical protein